MQYLAVYDSAVMSGVPGTALAKAAERPGGPCRDPVGGSDAGPTAAPAVPSAPAPGAESGTVPSAVPAAVPSAARAAAPLGAAGAGGSRDVAHQDDAALPASAAVLGSAAQAEPAVGRRRFIPASNSPEDVERARLAAVEFLLQAQGLAGVDGVCDVRPPAESAAATLPAAEAAGRAARAKQKVTFDVAPDLFLGDDDAAAPAEPSAVSSGGTLCGDAGADPLAQLSALNSSVSKGARFDSGASESGLGGLRDDLRLADATAPVEAAAAGSAQRSERAASAACMRGEVTPCGAATLGPPLSRCPSAVLAAGCRQRCRQRRAWGAS